MKYIMSLYKDFIFVNNKNAANFFAAFQEENIGL